MLKTTLSILILSLYTFSAFAQDEEIALGKMNYRLKIAFLPIVPSDTVKKYLTQEHTLYFGKSTSLNIEYGVKAVNKVPTLITLKKDTIELSEKNIKDNKDLQKVSKQAKTEMNTDTYTSSTYRTYSSQERYTVVQDNDLATINTDSLSNIHWKLSDEEKTISDLKVHKATGTFKGRNYTVWYAKQIPVPTGPWKLHGLPGLIIEASDDRMEVVIELVLLDIPTANFIVKKPIPKGKVLTKEALLAERKKRIEETQKMIQAEKGDVQNRKIPRTSLSLVTLELKN